MGDRQQKGGGKVEELKEGQRVMIRHASEATPHLYYVGNTQVDQKVRYRGWNISTAKKVRSK